MITISVQVCISVGSLVLRGDLNTGGSVLRGWAPELCGWSEAVERMHSWRSVTSDGFNSRRVKGLERCSRLFVFKPEHASDCLEAQIAGPPSEFQLCRSGLGRCASPGDAGGTSLAEPLLPFTHTSRY